MSKVNEPFKEVVFLDGVKWKLVPGYIATYASEKGEIAFLSQTGEMKKCPIVKWHNTSVDKRSDETFYLHAKVIDESYNIAKRAIHQLVCLAYHGYPPADGRRYEPNHVNAIKTDNSPSNLEWVTRSRNIEHLYDQGLHAGGIGIIAENVVTGATIRYSSLSALCRVVGETRQSIRNFIYKHQTVPKDDWTYRFDSKSDKPVNRYQERSVIFKDYLTGKVTVAESLQKAADITGLKWPTIRFRIMNSRLRGKNEPLGRYFFQDFSTDPVWPEFTEQQIAASVAKFGQK